MSTAVNIRGTSGSGKTTVVTRLIDHLEKNGYSRSTPLEESIGGKTRKVGLWVGPVFLAGRYDTTCGGCDTMSWKGAADDVCRLVREHVALKESVVFEGLMVSGWGTGRLRDLWKATEERLVIIQLTTPLKECLESIGARREAAHSRKMAEKGLNTPPLKPLNPENTTAKWHGTMRGSELLQKSGVPVLFLDREAAYHRAKELLS